MARMGAGSRMTIKAALTLTLGLGALACGSGDPEARAAEPHEWLAEEVLDDAGASLGSVAFPVACTDEATGHMQRGLALLHHMTYTEADASFNAASHADPACALAYWGRAMSLVHPLWPDVPSEEDFDRGQALLAQAGELAGDSPWSVAWIRALDGYYQDGAVRSEPERLASLAAGWADVVSRYPDDPEATLFRALALVASAQGQGAAEVQRRQAGEMAEAVLERIPDHPGAHHYVIHAFDVPALAERALPTAQSYGEVAPENAHALHMTSHIFTRVGDWERSIDFNQRSADAALASPIAGMTSHHHLHALDYLAYAHLQRADDEAAGAVADHVASLGGPVVNHAASAYAFAAVPARLALERGAWDEAMSLEARTPGTIDWDGFPHLEAITHFARALGAARTGDLAAAERAVGRLDQLAAAAADLPSAYDWGIQVRIQATAARAWMEFAAGRTDGALELMSEAADLESSTDKNPVTPSEVLPAGELLGDMLVELERYSEATRAYEAALERSPNRLNSLFGAGRAAERAGEADVARVFYERLLSVVAPAGAAHPAVVHARTFLGA